MKYKPKTTLPETVKSMFINQETDNTTTRARIDSDNTMEDLQKCDEIIYHDVGIEKFSEEEEMETEEEDDD